MDFTVALILVGIGVVAVLAREGYQRARAQPTARYLEALRRVHDTAHLEDPHDPDHPEERPLPGQGVTGPVPKPPAPPATAYEPPPPPLYPAGVRTSGGARRHNPPRLLAGGRALVAGAVVVAVLAASGVGYVLAHHGTSAPARASVPTTLPPVAKKSAPTSTTTLAPSPPPQPVVVPGAQTSGSAAYTVSSGPVQLALATSSRCWVELRAVSAIGPVVFEGILSPGATRAFENAVGLWLRLGYPPGVLLAVDGRPVGLPTSSSPIDVTVNSATASTA